MNYYTNKNDFHSPPKIDNDNNNNNNNNNRFTTKDSYTWNITHSRESTAV